MGLFDGLFGGAAKEASKAAEANRQLYQGYENKGIGALDTAYDASKGYLDQNQSTFDDLAGLGEKYGGATNLLLGGLGAGTDADRTAAYDAFRAQPGRQYAIDTATDAAARRAMLSASEPATSLIACAPRRRTSLTSSGALISIV